MKQVLSWTFSAGFLLLAFSGHAQSTTEQAVAKLVRDFRAAEQAYDPAALARLIDEHYVEISPLGEVDERTRFLGFYQPSQRQTWPSIAVSEEQIRVVGTTALDVLKLTYTMPGPGNEVRSRSVRATFVAQHEVAGWRLLGAHYTAIPPAAPPTPSSGQPVK